MASLGDVQYTLSSWDNCMSKAYCKWPVVVAIIIGSLIVLSVVFCIARCLCFGAECCACCCSCLSCCCPSRRRSARGGYENYQHPPPPPVPYTQYPPQYSSPPAPLYGQSSPYRGPKTATFETSTKSPATARYNEDALPPMPSWDNATTRHIEEEPVEMERLNDQRQAQQHLLAEQDRHAQAGYHQSSQNLDYQNQVHTQDYAQGGYNNLKQGYEQGVSDQSTHYTGQRQDYAYAGDMGHASTAPYHDYSDHRQYAPSMSPTSSTAYAPSTTMPPSYHTRDSTVVSPIQNSYTPVPARRPVQGSWRDV